MRKSLPCESSHALFVLVEGRLCSFIEDADAEAAESARGAEALKGAPNRGSLTGMRTTRPRLRGSLAGVPGQHAWLRPGDFFGEAALVASLGSGATVLSTTRARLLRLDQVRRKKGYKKKPCAGAATVHVCAD